VLRQAETGLPIYVDTGVVAAPHFVEISTLSAGASAETDACADRSDWRSLDHQLTCRSYRGDAKERNWCSDVGYYDPSILNPKNATSKIQWDVPAHVACPTACRMCMTCVVNTTTVNPSTLAARRRANIVIDGCRVGYDCVDIKGAPLMEGGIITPTAFDLEKEENPTAKLSYIPIPPFSASLTIFLQELHYHCRLSTHSNPDLSQKRSLVDLAPGVVFDSEFMFRVFSATPHSLVRYTLDGSEPRYDHGIAVMSGDIVSLKQSAQVRAIAHLDPATHVAIQVSRIVMLPFIRIRLRTPTMEISSVGHYRRAWSSVQSECAENSSWVSSLIYTDFEYVRSNGCPQFAWSTPNPLNVARHQAWSFPLPLKPMLSFVPLSVTHIDGIIGLARNGVPFFAPPHSAQDEAFLLELKEMDACGGLALSIRQKCEGGTCLFETTHHGQYHYRVLPTCLDSTNQSHRHSAVVGMM